MESDNGDNDGLERPTDVCVKREGRVVHLPQRVSRRRDLLDPCPRLKENSIEERGRVTDEVDGSD